MSQNPLYVGIDIGSSFTKIVILDQNSEIYGSNVNFSGINLQDAAERTLLAALPQNISITDIEKIITTGFGRKSFKIENIPVLP
ncbi:MAG: hypothetical protein ACXACU_18620, partial [Candidatus Hodarchaeales archaeon]